jgi:hypothetical protein
MKISAAKRAFLVAQLGEEKVADLERRLMVKSQELEAAGVDFKSLDGILGNLGKTSEEEQDAITPYAALLTGKRETVGGGAPPTVKPDAHPASPYLAELVKRSGRVGG